jgi:hypothetical protein
LSTRGERAPAIATRNPTIPSESAVRLDWNADDQSLLAATLSATLAQRLVWLEEALCLAYARGALKPKRLIEKEE